MRPTPPHVRTAPARTDGQDAGPIAGHGELAGRGRRLAAGMFDGMLVLGLAWTLAQATGLDVLLADIETAWPMRLAAAAAGTLVFIAVQAYPLLRRGQTIGKMLLDIRIARPDGSPASAGRLALRYGISLPLSVVPGAAQVYALADCLAIFRRSRRCLHDSVADTVVLKR